MKVKKIKWTQDLPDWPTLWVTLSDGTVLEIPVDAQKRLVTEKIEQGRGLVCVRSANVPKELQVPDLKFDGELYHKPQTYTNDKNIVRLAKEFVNACRQGKFEEKEETFDDC